MPALGDDEGTKPKMPGRRVLRSDRTPTGKRRGSAEPPEQKVTITAPEDRDDDEPSPKPNLSRRASLHSRSLSPAQYSANTAAAATAAATTTSAPATTSPRPTRDRSDRRVSSMPKEASTSASSESNVRVMVRVRPFGDKEIQTVQEEGGYIQSVIDMPRSDQVLLLDHKSDYEVLQGFNFDEVFWSCTQQKSNLKHSAQRDVYEATGMLALQAAWEGINSCIFAYGQTGSGKTHTMMGDPSQIANPEGCDEELLGLIPRLCRDLFDELMKKEDNAISLGMRRKSDVRVRFYEIYNEKVKDLLSDVRLEGSEGVSRFKYEGTGTSKRLDTDDLKIREHPTDGPYVEGITIHQPRHYQDIITLINAGNQARSVGCTNLNDRSSRSHAIFRITVTQTTFYDQARVGIGGPKTTTHQRRANINLVDLAGSENVKRSGATGQLMIEAQKINLSLTTLRRVIDALIEKKQNVKVPYRDSALTWLLREDLGGNAKTFMMATVSPHYLNSHESQRTLEYAMRARSIINSVRVNEDETAKMIADLEKKMREVAQQMSTAQSEAEKADLQQQMVETEKARVEIEERLEEAETEASAYKERLAAEQEKNMAFAFRHAVMLKAAKARISAAEEKDKETSKILSSIKEKMAETGHEDIHSLTAELTKERNKSERLEKEISVLKEKNTTLDDQLSSVKRTLADETSQAKLDKHAAEAVNRETTRKELEWKSELARVKAGYEEEIKRLTTAHHEEIEAKNQEQTLLRASHTDEMGRVVVEAEKMFNDCQQTITEAKIENERQRQDHTQALRVIQEEKDRQQRILHSDIRQREEMIDAMEVELHQAKKEIKKMREQLRVAQELSMTEKGAALHDLEMAHKKEKERMILDNESTCHKLRGEIQEADNHAAECEKQRQEMVLALQDVQRKEDKYERHFDLVTHFLSLLPDGDVPPTWTMQDVKKVVAAFNQYKSAYASYRPNRDQLKTMIREGQLGKRNMGMGRLLTGMKCPSLQSEDRSVPRSDARDAGEEAPFSTSVADELPFVVESGLLPSSPVFVSRSKVAKQSRSKSSPRHSDPYFESPQVVPTASTHTKRKSITKKTTKKP